MRFCRKSKVIYKKVAISIIFQDDYLLVLEKPPFLVVDKSRTQQENTLENWLGSRQLSAVSSQLERQGIVHRLDKDTSGLILVAKTPKVLENLQKQFQDRVVKKEYLALVHGTISDAGRIEGAIGRNQGNREKFSVVLEGKEAVTEYEPIKRLMINDLRLKNIFNDLNKIQMRKLERMHYNQFTLTKCHPQTGRTHQIRVHLKHIGHPIVADEKYAGRKIYRLDKRWCPRQFLHASRIEFRHPETNKWMEFESKLPEDLDKSFSLLKA